MAGRRAAEDGRRKGVTPWRALHALTGFFFIFNAFRMIEAYRISSSVSNVALKKPAFISEVGVYDGIAYPASLAVDGNNGQGNWGNQTCASTSLNSSAPLWWKVDLQIEHLIDWVKIFNRQDCCADQLDNVQVWVGNNNDSITQNTQCSPFTIFAFSTDSTGFPHIQPCYARGRYVWVYLPQSIVLTICEVEVYGAPNLAVNKPAFESSMVPGAGAFYAVNGIASWNFADDCSSTKEQSDPWWYVDLRGIFNVNVVKIFNRLDCDACLDLLNGVEIWVGNSSSSWNAFGNVQCNPDTNFEYSDINPGFPFTIDCFLSGRYVWAHLPGDNRTLTLCEVQAFGTPATLLPELRVLMDFKRGITSDPNAVLDNWVYYGDCTGNHWNGVVCDTSGAVNIIFLNSQGLTGTITPSIGILSKIVFLSLGDNSFSGGIPTTITNLKSLQYLDLYGNPLGGTLPSNIGNMTSLVLLSAFDCSLTGTLPASLGNLQYLWHLFLDGNSLSGVIPGSIASMTSLRNLFLCNNRFTGELPPTIADLPYLTELDVQNNYFTGPIISTFQSSLIKYVNFRYNYFSGSPILYNSSGEFCPQDFTSDFSLLNPPVFGSLADNCLNADPSSACLFEPQGSPSDCSAFCDSYQTQGACGGHGQCIPGSDSTEPTCVCDSGYRSTNSGNTCVFGAFTFGLSIFPQTSISGTGFRYASTGYLNSLDKKPSWLAAMQWDWSQQGALRPVKSQGPTCNACWAFAAAATLETAYFLYHGGASLPDISVEHILDCAATSGCDGDWPGTALDFVIKNGVATSSAYPYAGSTASKNCGITKKSLKVTSYEMVNFYGWIGLMLAVQQQSVIVTIRASHISFINYNGGIYDDDTCSDEGVDHSVVVYGYDLTTSPQHWKIRNSWGPAWGENGDMRMAIRGGTGICNINTLPAIYPVMKGADPCNTNSFGKLKLQNAVGPGMLNPCGGYSCSAVRKQVVVNGVSSSVLTNKCNCRSPFTVAVAADGSESCVPASPCTFFTFNPCGQGACVDVANSPGSYACVCPLGLELGTFAADGKPTCIWTSNSSSTYFVVTPTTCDTIIQLYGFTLSAFLQMNPGINCTAPLPAETNVTVAFPLQLPNCNVTYAINKGDTCDSIGGLLKMSISQIVGPNSLNPSFDCSNLQPGQQMCISKGSPSDILVPTSAYIATKGDTCASIIANLFNGDSFMFFALNRGIYCIRLVVSTSIDESFGQEIYLTGERMTGIAKGCTAQTYAIRKGDTCAKLVKLYFGNKKSTYKTLNNKEVCLNRNLHVARVICIPLNAIVH